MAGYVVATFVAHQGWILMLHRYYIMNSWPMQALMGPYKPERAIEVE